MEFGGGPFKSRNPKTREGIELNSGALLVRQWKGKLQKVMVLDEGFAWNGQTFGSLSQVAKAITGTSWNGHRFFGLRSTKNHRAAPCLSKRGRSALAKTEPQPFMGVERPRASKDARP